MNPQSMVPRVERVGLALAALFVLWTAFVALRLDRSPRATVSTVLLSAAAYALGRVGSRYVTSWLIPAMIMILAYAVFIESPSGTLSNLSSHGFLGYANAKAAFFVQAAFATAIIVASVRSPVVAVLSLPAIVLFVMVPVHARSLGGFLSSLLLIPGLVVAVVGKGARVAVALAAVVALGGIATSVVLAREFAADRATAHSGKLAARVDEGRAGAWADSYRLLRDHPALGVGPGGFGENSPTAAEEPDLRWAHNEFLQQGAETGVLGFALLVGLTGWLFWKLWSVGSTPAAVAALAVSSLVIHACAEYLFHFPLLPAATAALAGSASTLGERGSSTP